MVELFRGHSIAKLGGLRLFLGLSFLSRMQSVMELDVYEKHEKSWMLFSRLIYHFGLAAGACSCLKYQLV